MTEIKNKKKIRNDIICITALLLILAIVGGCLLLFREEGNSVKVTVDGQTFGTYSLNENQTVEVRTEKGYNIVIIENGTVRVEEASCPDGVGSSHRPIRFSGSSIICLPNKVVVSIDTEQQEEGGLDITSK